MPQESSWRGPIAVLITLILLIGGAYYWFVWRTPRQNATPPMVSLDQPGTNNFSKAGTIVRNNPGMKPDTWYLVYDESGAPARSVELLLTPESRCMIGSFDGRCTDALLVSGSRVEIVGYQAGSQVYIHTYRQVDLEQKG